MWVNEPDPFSSLPLAPFLLTRLAPNKGVGMQHEMAPALCVCAGGSSVNEPDPLFGGPPFWTNLYGELRENVKNQDFHMRGDTVFANAMTVRMTAGIPQLEALLKLLPRVLADN